MGKKKEIVGEDGKTYKIKEKKPFFKKVWFWVLIVLVIIIGASLSGGDSKKGTAKKVDSAPKTSEKADSKKDEKTGDKKEVDFKVGDTVDIDGYQIKVNKVDYSEGTEFSKPEDGKEFAIINITITNKTGKKTSFNPLDYSINQNGVSSSAGFTYLDNVDTLSSGDLDPDATVTGNLVAEVKKDTPFKLRYDGNFFLEDKEVDIIVR